MPTTTRTVRHLAFVLLLSTGITVLADRDDPVGGDIRPGPQADKGRAPGGDVKDTPEPSVQPLDPHYRIRPGDSLELTFTLTPEFDETVIVRPDGYVTLRGTQDLMVAGLTTSALRQKLQEAYASILREPVMTVTLKDFEKSYFLAFGEVMKPGKYDLRGDTTVTEAIAIVGGFNDRAKHSQVLLFRGVSAEWLEVKQLNVKRMLSEEGIKEDLVLRPGDLLFVPRTFLSRIKELVLRSGLGFYLRPTF